MKVKYLSQEYNAMTSEGNHITTHSEGNYITTLLTGQGTSYFCCVMPSVFQVDEAVLIERIFLAIKKNV